MAAHNDALNVFLHVDEERTLAQARALDNEGRSGIAGVPIAYKDLLCIRDVPTTAGSRVLEGYRPPYTATVVRRCEAAGLVELGKTNMDEFAMGSSTENSAYGPTRNPWDRERVPGRLERRLGGRGGRRDGAALARHRHRRLDPPARGAVRRRRHEADLRRRLALRRGRVRQLARPGRARSRARVRDCALALRVIAGPDVCDSTCLGPPEPIELPEREDLRGLRVGAISLDGIGGVEPGVRASYEAALETVRGARRRARRGQPRVLAHAARARGLLPDRAGRGVREPGPLRRRALRPARAGRRRLRDVRRARASGASAARSSAAA